MEGRPDAPPAAPCDGGWTDGGGSSIFNETIQWIPVSDPQKPIPSYQPVLPYGEIGRLVRRYRQIMPESTHDALDEFAEALELAATGVKNRDFECSHFDGADISFCAVMGATQGLPLETTQFVAKLAGQLADAFDVLRNGHAIEDKPDLRDPADQLARIVREQERGNRKGRPPER